MREFTPEKVAEVASMIATEASRAVLYDNKLAPSIRATLKDTQADFIEIVGTMLWLVESDDDAKRAELLRTLFAGVIGASFTIGALSKPKNELLSRLASTRRATEARLARSRVIDEIVRTRARPIFRKYRKRSPNWVAEQIINAVNEELGRLGLPSMKVDALRKRVGKLRTDERSSS